MSVFFLSSPRKQRQKAASDVLDITHSWLMPVSQLTETLQEKGYRRESWRSGEWQSERWDSETCIVQILKKHLTLFM